ncbi:L,D-transpeptidase family protein [Solitalea lacus]|uniref:L,D-transpeptidase family protein n=1 Tax=Solitalea lacus TaxID=2911172 RepID=UPI001EDA6528|nr:L,D-transpeptidase family protein [Solitalea lacus]UKJ05764.1 L,D-transpeptidase family protein [Solitalea lacus]
MKILVKYFNYSFRIVIVLLFVNGITGCGPKPSATGIYLSELFKDKKFKKFDTAAFNDTLRKELRYQRKNLVNYKLLSTFFNEQAKSDTAWFIALINNNQLDTLLHFVNKANEHGLSSQLFYPSKIDSLKKRFYQGKFDSLPQLYTLVAKLQIYTANALVSYSSKVKYGCVNPSKIYTRYYIPVKRPTDSILLSLLRSHDWGKILTDIQPKRIEYLILQKALDSCTNLYLRKKILVNMERYRWQIPSDSNQYIQVNIPAFSLKMVDSGKTVLTMDVCVGEKRVDDYAAKKEIYLKSGLIEDKPKNHETPIMYGLINNIQLNPKWNIPNSIAQTELLAKIRANPYYLVRSGIRVYNKQGQAVDPTEIDWDNVNPNNIPYRFKQDPGEGNALGKFKFNFSNKSSIYLHDTPNKSAFMKQNRAVSHGCIRVADPLNLAQHLVKNARMFDDIRMETGYPPIDTLRMKRFLEKQEMQSANGRQTRWMILNNKWPLYIDYYTCVPLDNGALKLYEDVYEYDEILLDSLKRFLKK